MKNIIIYTSQDEIISFPIIKKIVKNKKFKNFKFDLVTAKPKFIRKLKILIILFFSGSLKQLFRLYMNRVTINEINSKNVEVRSEPRKKYDFGISINYLKKIKKQKYKIYNFHLGNLYSQRGSFIFFYKYLRNWKTISLTFHLITDKFDTGFILNEKIINLKSNISAIEIMNIYNQNINFMVKSIDLVIKRKGSKKKFKKYLYLNVVPPFYKIFLNFYKLF